MPAQLLLTPRGQSDEIKFEPDIARSQFKSLYLEEVSNGKYSDFQPVPCWF